jgi:NADP-dependent 3-hydroxy acid dehydrogenase YdfG
MSNPKTILITGASSGIGLACAKLFSHKGHRLILLARRKDRLVELAKDLKTPIILLEADVRKQIEVKNAINSIPEEWKRIDILINSAGLAAGFETIDQGSLADWEQMLDTNVKGLLYVTKEVLPEMIVRKSGHIINISSTAGKEIYEKGNVYCASKSAVEALSKSFRIDLLQHQIKVTNIAPGMVETEFSEVRFKGDKEKAKNVYKGLQPLSPEDVANAIYFSATLPPNVCINDLTITALAQANSVYNTRKS